MATVPTLPFDVDSLDDYVDRFEEAWLTGDPPALEAYLPPASHPRYGDVLLELVRVDLERRSASPSFQGIAPYLDPFPQLTQGEETRQTLAFEEYRLRIQRGEPARAEDYARRYDIDTSGWPGTAGSVETVASRNWSNSTLDLLQGDTDRLVRGIDAFPPLDSAFAGFQLQELLGEGAFSRVYLARQGDLANRPVALKVSTELWSESQKLARLQHTHIVPVYSVHRAGGLQAICMPFFGRSTLAEVLDSAPCDGTWDLSSALTGGRSRTLSGADAIRKNESMACQLVMKLADGLDHAHGQGVIHRDLKPANVLVRDDGEPMLLDFNLSEDLVVGGRTSLLVGGTLPYMAPEHLKAVLSGDALDARTDIYSLGVLFFQLVTRSLPFPIREGSFTEAVSAMVADRYRIPWEATARPVVSIDGLSILQRCLAANPGDRYASASQLRCDLERHLVDQPLRYAPNRSVWARGRKWLRRHRHLVSHTSVTAVAVLALSILAGLWGVQRHRSARLEAKDQFRHAIHDIDHVRMGLGMPGIPDEVQTELHQRTRDLMQLYRVGTGADWRKSPGFALLGKAEQGELESLIADLASRLKPPVGSPKTGEGMGGTRVPLPQFVAASPEGDRYRQAVALLRSKRLVEARPLLEMLTQAQPHDAVYWFLYGNCLAGLGHHSEAEDSFSRALALQPRSPLPPFHRGLCRLAQQQYLAAEMDFTLVLEHLPHSVAARFNRALARKAAGRFEAAMDDLNWILQRDANHTRARMARSECHAACGQPSLAEQDREAAIASHPNLADDWIARGVAHLPNDPQSAMADFQQALQRDPASRDALQNIAHVQAELLKQPEEAQKTLAELLKRDPADSTLLAGLATLAARRNDRKTALDQVQQALALRQDALTCYQAASTYALLSKSDDEYAEQAISLLRKCLRQDPKWLQTVIYDSDFLSLRENPRFLRVLAATQELTKGDSGSDAKAPGEGGR